MLGKKVGNDIGHASQYSGKGRYNKVISAFLFKECVEVEGAARDIRVSYRREFCRGRLRVIKNGVVEQACMTISPDGQCGLGGAM